MAFAFGMKKHLEKKLKLERKQPLKEMDIGHLHILGPKDHLLLFFVLLVMWVFI